MTGLLAAGALAGAVSVGWPVYLHLRRRQKPAVLTVPSLRLFAHAPRPRAWRLFERVVLLVSRAMFLVLLWAMVAQPWLRTDVELPLPLIGEEEIEECCVGVVLDESLTSLHGPAERTRLDASRAWLRERIGSLPEHARVVMVLSTFPHPTRPMTKARALELLGTVRAIPRSGRAAEALAAVEKKLRGRRGAIVVAAPRNGALWQDLADGTDLERPAAVHFLDTTPLVLPWHIRSVSPAAGGEGAGGWRCDLAGDPEAMRDRELVVEGRDGKTWRCRVGEADARRGRVTLLLPRRPPPFRYTVRSGDGRHPWTSWHFRGEGVAPAEARGGAAIVRRPTREGLAAEKVVTAALLALRPDGRIHHLDSRGSAAELPEADALVLIGDERPAPAILSWARERLRLGARMLCIPPASGCRSPGGADDAGPLPAWGPPSAVPAAATRGLRRTDGLSSARHCVDDHLVRGLREPGYAALREPAFAGGSEVILRTADDRPFLVTRRFGESGRAWAISAPVTLREGGVAFHPAFPLLLDRLLFGGAEPEQTALGDVEVGGRVEILGWFGLASVEGALVLPDGRERPVLSPGGAPVWTDVSQAGPHLLRAADATRVRLANYPRLKRDVTFPREEWEARRPRTRTVWVSLPGGSGGSAPGGEIELARVGGERGPDDGKRVYDLGPAVLLALTLFLLAEGAALGVSWRRTAGATCSPLVPGSTGGRADE